MKRLLGCILALGLINVPGLLRADIQCFDCLIYQQGNYYLWLTVDYGNPTEFCTNCLGQNYAQTNGPHDAPQECEEKNCDQYGTLVTVARPGQLPAAIPEDHDFKQTAKLPPGEVMTTPPLGDNDNDPATGTKYNYNPLTGLEVQSEQWVIMTKDGADLVPVKLYVALWDFKKSLEAAGVPVELHKDTRVANVGFETAAVPKDEVAKKIDIDDATFVKDVTDYSFRIKPTKHSPWFTVFTNKDLIP